MSPRRHPRQASARTLLEGEHIDALYGLEPVFEPDAVAEAAVGVELYCVQCPYCGEAFETVLDLSAGSMSYVEDCQICCQPIEFSLEVDHTGALLSFSAVRDD